MPAITYKCEQAIFTSIRTPMGEGYRIIAASCGLRPEEKQAITRCSPSHGGLCDRDAEPVGPLGGVHGIAFYPLPTGRTCVALSCPAGAEHTGRGGQRVYTHCAVIESDDWPKLGYNPFNVLRAMTAAELTRPQLKPPNVVPELTLAVEVTPETIQHAAVDTLPAAPYRAYILQELLEQRHLIVNVDSDWPAVAEAFLLGIPGPLRSMISFGAGLRFSPSRTHNLDLLRGDDTSIRQKVAGKSVEYLCLGAEPPVQTQPSAWLTFVDRHWNKGDLVGLSRRTSRAIDDTGPGGREQLAAMYNTIDGITEKETSKLIAAVSVYLCQGPRSPNPELVRELLDKAGRTLADRFADEHWAVIPLHWPMLIALAKTSREATTFARPIVEHALRAGINIHPLRAAEATLDVLETHAPLLAAGSPARGTASAQGADEVVDFPEEVFQQLAAWAKRQHLGALTHDELAAPRDRWCVLRPNSPALDRLDRLCEKLAVAEQFKSNPVG